MQAVARRISVLSSFCLALGTPSVATAPDSLALFRLRRTELRSTLADGITILFGRQANETDDIKRGFSQDPDFYYLSGWREPGAILMLVPPSPDSRSQAVSSPREILFLPPRNLEQEQWTGQKIWPEHPAAHRISGFDDVLSTEAFDTEVRSLLTVYPRIYCLKYRAQAGLAALAPDRILEDAGPAIARMRMQKSAEEIALIERAADATIDAHRAAWRRAAPGRFEYQLAATLVFHFLDHGCERPAYAPTVGSGPNSTILHYSLNSRRMDAGDLAVIDAGAECAGYAADVTRTIPVSGRFTPRQREIYDIVLAAQKATIAAVKPGMTIAKGASNSLYQVAYDYIDSHGQDRHGDPLGKYFTHGISHHIGLEVHDAADNSAPLKEGMVISVEPGIYIPEENIGVRIEDMVLVTRDGARVLTAALPREAAEIEKAIAR